MKKTGFFTLLFVLALTVSAMAQTPEKFAGTWKLDKDKTKMQILPNKFTNYATTITLDDKKISFRNLVEGDFVVERVGVKTQLNSQSPGGFINRQTGSEGANKPNYGGTMALKQFSQAASYVLDGQTTTLDVKEGDKVVGTIEMKVKTEKDGKSLRVSQVRRMRMAQGEITIYVRERYDLSDDGKTMKFHRMVEFPAAMDEFNLTLVKSEEK